MKIFKVVAGGDEMYIQAKDQAAARMRLFEFTGPMPDSMLTWTEVTELPEGQEFL